jgi:adenine-specific DNA-methyltransferase
LAPAMFRRPTFPQLHEAKERLLAFRMCGETPAVIYDDKRLFSNHTPIVFVPWHLLKGVANNSISKTAKYRRQDPEGDREERERISQQFHLKYVLAVMNSTFAREWLAKRRRSKLHIYPDDWKPLPIAPIPLEQQMEFVKLVDAILAEFARHGYPLPPDAAKRVAELEREIDARVNRLYQRTPGEFHIVEQSLK